MEKRGQGLSTTAIVLIVLGVLVLVLLIMGFTMGWSKLAPWLSSSDIQKVVDSCSIACSTGGTYDFCSSEKTLTDEDTNEIKTNCALLAEVGVLQTYGVQKCSSIDCPVNKNCADIKIVVNNQDFIGVLSQTPCTSGGNDISSFAQDTDVTRPYCCLKDITNFK